MSNVYGGSVRLAINRLIRKNRQIIESYLADNEIYHRQRCEYNRVISNRLFLV